MPLWRIVRATVLWFKSILLRCRIREYPIRQAFLRPKGLPAGRVGSKLNPLSVGQFFLKFSPNRWPVGAPQNGCQATDIAEVQFPSRGSDLERPADPQLTVGLMRFK